MDPVVSPNDEARETLRQLEQRLRREVTDMVTVLAADVPVFFTRAVRGAFERSPRADELGEEAVRRLKAETESASRALAARVQEQLEPFETWLWDRPSPPPASEDLDAHPRVSAVLTSVGEELRRLVEAHGLTAADLGDAATYRLPSYFVKGHFMKSLVANFWRALADYQQLRGRVDEAAHVEERQRRRDRWESA